VLPATHRLRRSREFRSTVRQGVRVGRPHVVVHLTPNTDRTRPVRIGLVVDRAVGSAVVRNTVRRRLRHLLRDRIDELPAGSLVVVRARPSAAAAPSAALAGDLDAALTRAVSRAGAQR
jgi:ribonuclease P protein component